MDRDDRSWLPIMLLVGAIALGTLGWLAAVLLAPPVRFVVLAPAAKAGIDTVLALASLFGALVLWLFPDDGGRLRLRWIAAGFLVLGLGGLVFGYLYPLVADVPDLNRSRVVSLLVQTASGALFVAGLLPAVPRRPPSRLLLAIAAAVPAAGILIYALADLLPRFTTAADPETATEDNVTIMEGLTGWHWVLSTIPLLLAVLAVAGAARRHRDEGLGLWLVAAMALLVSAQLHGMLWPSGYAPVVTTASLLRLGFTLVVVLGGVHELRRIAAERERLLAAEREYGRRLGQLAVLRSDFTAMVVHELNGPVGAIRRLADLAAAGDPPPPAGYAVGAMQHELDLLTTLIADVQASAAVERDDFNLRLAPVPIERLLIAAASYATALPGEHPVAFHPGGPAIVRADEERVGQVLRNLLSNATKYSPPGSPIDVVAECRDGRLWISVVDRGYGIHPDDLERVLEKFGRGRDPLGQRVSGVGLGLYLSRRIVQAHGSDLTITSVLGAGTEVSFTLPLAQPA